MSNVNPEGTDAMRQYRNLREDTENKDLMRKSEKTIARPEEGHL